MTDTDWVHVPVPFREPFVLYGWGDSLDTKMQTTTIVMPDTVLDDVFPTAGTDMQRRITALRLRRCADLIDPDKEQT